MPRLGSIASIPFIQAGEVPTFALLSSIANPNNFGTELNDFFGISVANNGTKIITGSLESDATFSQNGAAYLFDINGTFDSVVENPNPAGGGVDSADNFGRAVDISETYMLVGSWSEDQPGDDEGGKAYLFNINTGNLIHTFVNPNPASPDQFIDGDRFGSAVAVTDGYSIVTAYREDAADGSGDNTGWAYVFDNTSGNLLYSIESPNIDQIDEYPGDQMGEFVQTLAADGSFAVVGSWQDNSSVDGLGDSGAIHIINLSNGNVTTIENPNNFSTLTFDRFGRSVDIKNSRIIVGATGEDTATNTEVGVAYIYDFDIDTSTWSLSATVEHPDAATNDQFGAEVAVADNYYAVASIQKDTGSGVVYVFDATDNTLLKTLENPNLFGTSDNDNFGTAMSAHEDYLTISTPAEDNAGGNNSGALYIYKTGI